MTLCQHSEHVDRDLIGPQELDDWSPDRDEPDGDPRERVGFGVCVRGDCVEPCGDFGGCKRRGRA